jgi:hypothetical protein
MTNDRACWRIAILLTLAVVAGLTVVAVKTGSGAGHLPHGLRKTRAEFDREAVVRNIEGSGAVLPAGAWFLDATDDSARDKSIWARIGIGTEDFDAFRREFVGDPSSGHTRVVPIAEVESLLAYRPPPWWRLDGYPDAKAYWKGDPKFQGVLLIYSESRGEMFLHMFNS